MSEALHVGCHGKHSYADPSLAEKVARRLRRHHEKAVQAYRCGRCNRWHVGSRDRWQDGKP